MWQIGQFRSSSELRGRDISGRGMVCVLKKCEIWNSGIRFGMLV